MQRVLIVEDDKNQLNMLHTWIHESHPGWDIHCASNLKEAFMLLKNSLDNKQTYTLFLLDVQLSSDTTERGGFILATEIRKHSTYYTTPLLFLTSISEEVRFALSSFHCYNYITKPYEQADIIQQLKQMIFTGHLKEHSLFIKDEFQIQYNIPLKDILFIQASGGHMLTIYTGESSFNTKSFSLDSIMDKLGDNFFRCHKKYIVNLTHIHNYDATTRYIHINNYTITVGKTYKNAFKNKWGSFS